MQGGGKGAGGAFAEPPASVGAPTYAELGLTKKEAALAQNLVALPEGIDLVAFVKSADGRRRHMTASQSAVAYEARDQ
jgi:hypothetical protein